jgi:glycosyltransferase involved in cell wall biosynthesis
MYTTSSPPLFSVLLCNYNYANYVGSAIQSVLSQTLADFELIVVDDGSTDNSVSVITSFLDHRIKLIQQDNAGQAAAFNRAFAASRGKYIAFLDSDDFWSSDKLERVADVFLQHANVSLVQHPMSVVDEHSRVAGKTHPPITFSGKLDLLREYQLQKHTNFFSTTSGIACTRESLQNIFPIDRNWKICADVLFTRPSPLFGFMYTIAENLGSYRIHGANNWNGGAAQKELDSNNRLYVDYTNEWLARFRPGIRIDYDKSVVHQRIVRSNHRRFTPSWFFETVKLNERKCRLVLARIFGPKN